MYQAWNNATGSWPDSQTFRDLVMSTADDRGYDPLVQGAGWMCESRSRCYRWYRGVLMVSPASWMTAKTKVHIGMEI